MRRRWSGWGFSLTAVVSFLVIAEAHEDLDERIRQGILPLCPHAEFVNGPRPVPIYHVGISYVLPVAASLLQL